MSNRGGDLEEEERPSPGVVVWTTGRPSAGKSTFAHELRRSLGRRGVPCCVLDGDEVRTAIVPSPGYDAEGRAAFYETLARLAAVVASQGMVTIVAATAHRREFRERARSLAPRFVEIFVDTPPDECARRDAKGLYAAAATGRVSSLPGSNVAYEPPGAPDVVATGGLDEAAIERVVNLLLELRAAPPRAAPAL